MKEVNVVIRYNNFKEACMQNGLLEPNAENPRGNTRKKLEKELSTICKWHKVQNSNAIIVDEIYETKLLKEDKRRDKGIYITPIKLILLYTLRNSQSELYISVNKLIELLGIFNKQYFELGMKTPFEMVSIEEEIDIRVLKSFKFGSTQEVRRIIERALKSMKAMGIIDYMQGRIIITVDGECRFATDDELKKIKRIEQEQLQKLNCHNMISLKYRNLQDKFYRQVKKQFRQKALEYIDYTFNGYLINYYDKTISEKTTEIENEEQIYILKQLIRKRLLEYAIWNNNREIKKCYEQVVFGEPILELNPVASNLYVPSFKRAIKIFM